MTRRSLASCGLVAGPLAHSTACARDAGNGVTRSQGVSTKAMGRRCLTFQQSTFFVMICCGETNFFCSIVHHPRSVLGVFRDTAVLVISCYGRIHRLQIAPNRFLHAHLDCAAVVRVASALRVVCPARWLRAVRSARTLPSHLNTQHGDELCSTASALVERGELALSRRHERRW